MYMKLAETVFISIYLCKRVPRILSNQQEGRREGKYGDIKAKRQLTGLHCTTGSDLTKKKKWLK